MPSLAELEEWLEEQWPQNLQDLPHKITETVYWYSEVLYEQLTKYGPPSLALPPALKETLDELRPSINSALGLQEPLPPTPPPPPPTRLERIASWTKGHKYALAGGAAVAIVGLGLAYRQYPAHFHRVIAAATRKRPVRRAARVRNGLRREAVVVLGADTPIGRAVLLALAAQGLIVIATVSSAASLKSFDAQLPPSSRGYVAVRHFSPASDGGGNGMAEAVAGLAAEVHATLALRFPLTAAGDPFARPGDSVTLIGIVNALSYVAPGSSPAPSSLAAAAGPGAGAVALSRAMDQHVAGPLAAIAALLPEIRIAQKRMFSGHPECLSPVTILSLVAAPASSLPHGAHTAQSAAQRIVSKAAADGADALRNEIAAAPPSAHSRPVRMTVLEVATPTTGSASASISAPAGSSPSRPGVPRSLSGSPSASASVASAHAWQSKDAHTLRLQARVADLILAADTTRALKRRYAVRAPLNLVALWRGFVASYVPPVLVSYAQSAWDAQPIHWLRALASNIQQQVRGLRRGGRKSRRGPSTGGASADAGSAANSQQLVRSNASFAAQHQQRMRQKLQEETLPTPGTPGSSGTPSHADLEPPSGVSASGSGSSRSGGSGDEGAAARRSAASLAGPAHDGSDHDTGSGSGSEGFVLHSAPSSYNGDAEDRDSTRWSSSVAGSPWLGPESQLHSQVHSRAATSSRFTAPSASTDGSEAVASPALSAQHFRRSDSDSHGHGQDQEQRAEDEHHDSAASSAVLGGSWVRLSESDQGAAPQQ